MNRSRVLITGATGFIGGFLVKEAINHGYEVIAAVRASSDTTDLEHLSHVQVVLFDFEIPEAIAQVLVDYNIDYIINNAGLTRSKSQEELNTVNAVYLKNLIEGINLSTQPIKRITHISSLAAFGPADFQPDRIVSRTSTPHPVTMYGRSKLLGEAYLKEAEGLDYVIIRPTAVYGPKEKDLYTVFKMINSGIETKAGLSEQLLTFVYVADLVKYMVKSLTLGPSTASYFISDGSVYTNTQFNTIVRQSLGARTLKITIPLPILKLIGTISEFIGNITNTYPPLNTDKVNEIKARSWACDTSPNKALQYTPQYQLKDGVAITSKWYKDNNWI